MVWHYIIKIKRGVVLMKRLIALLCVISLLVTLCGCAKKCSECGDSVKDPYMVFGKYLCEDCMW